MGHFVSSPRESEKRDKRGSRKGEEKMNESSDPSIPGLVTIVLNTYFIDMMMLWL